MNAAYLAGFASATVDGSMDRTPRGKKEAGPRQWHIFPPAWDRTTTNAVFSGDGTCQFKVPAANSARFYRLVLE